MTKPQEDTILFIIDTDQYAGNFDRQMCAYITGQIGECRVGNEYRIRYNTDTKNTKNFRGKLFSEIIKQVPDENGCHRPVSSWETPGLGKNKFSDIAKVTEENKEEFDKPANCSVAIFFESLPSAEMVEFMKERAQTFNDAFQREEKWRSPENITILGCRLVRLQVKFEETEIFL